MNNESQHIEFDDLVIRFLSNESTSDENEKIAAAISSNEALKERFLELKKLYNSSVQASHVLYDSTTAYKEFLDKTTQKQSIPIERGKWYFSRVLQIAAVALLLLGLWFFSKNNRENILTETIVAQNDKANFTFEDSSLVYLNKNSTILFPNEFSADFRKIHMSGEAYFEITPNSQKPFIIELDDVTVTVLGTSFLIKEKDDKSTVSVIVNSGKVKVETMRGGKTIILTKGERVDYRRATNSLSKSINEDDNFLAWQTGLLKFNDTRLVEVVDILADFYNVAIELENPDLYFCQLTAKYDNYSLETVFEMLELTFNITISKSGDSYSITGERCSF